MRRLLPSSSSTGDDESDDYTYAGIGAGPAYYEANKKTHYEEPFIRKRIVHAESVATELKYPHAASGFPECMQGVQYTDQMRYSMPYIMTVIAPAYHLTWNTNRRSTEVKFEVKSQIRINLATSHPYQKSS